MTEFDDGLAAVSYSFDPLGRLTAVDTVDYTYDGLCRVADREGADVTYQGFSLDPVTDGSFTYSRSPGGRLAGISDGVDDLLVGSDRHRDLTHLFEVAEILGLAQRNTVSSYQKRYPDMPRPVVDLGAGRCKM